MTDTVAAPAERTLTARALLVALLDATTADQVTVPRSVLEAVAAEVPPAAGADLGPVDLTVPDLAARFNRAPSTIRQWLERGDVPGAYRLEGREWRVPPGRLAGWRYEGQKRSQAATPGRVDLSSWRTKLGSA